jgi:hypothetical protein
MRLLPLFVLALALALPGAAAAGVVNGGFEDGLRGWHVQRATESGDWFAYQGTAAPIGKHRDAPPVQAPPQGERAAIADEANPDTLVLYQDVELPAGTGQQLSLLAYYDSYKPIAVPTPDTLSVDEAVLGGRANQQFRIDVVRPDAPIESVDPADVLLTVFRTKAGAPARMKPTRFTADLSALAGQTVRLRVVVAAGEEVLNGGVDAVALATAGGGPGGSSRLGFGKPKVNRKTGTVLLPVQVPNTGLLSAGKRKVIQTLTVKAPAAKTVTLRLRPTAATRQRLERGRKVRVEVAIVFLPAEEARETATVAVVLQMRPKRGR